MEVNRINELLSLLIGLFRQINGNKAISDSMVPSSHTDSNRCLYITSKYMSCRIVG